MAYYAWLRRRDRDPLGPPPSGGLPDTTVAALLAIAGMLLLRVALFPLLAGSAWVTAGGFAAQLGVYTGANFVLALCLLPGALRGGPRPSVGPARLALAGVATGFALFTVQAPVGALIAEGFRRSGRAVPVQEVVSAARTAEGTDVVVFAVGALVLAPFAEEVVFRGILFPALARPLGPRLANAAQALLFGAIHVHDASQALLAIPLAVVGWFAGWIYVRTGSLAASVLVHVTFNAINFAALRNS